jgi:3-phenylpropionate/cinnamic acid dioxygenase small subunit
MTTSEIEQFLYREALLMDEHRYQEWLSLDGRRDLLGPMRARGQRSDARSLDHL